MKSKTKGKGNNGQSTSDAPAIVLKPFNRLEFPRVPADAAPAKVLETLSHVDEAHQIEAVPGLHLIQANDVAATFPPLAQFPLGVSPKSGNFNGRLMNISDYCRRVTGRAWSQAHADKVKAEEGRILQPLDPVKDKDLRKAISAELDGMRVKYHDTLKGIAGVLLTRKDVTVTNTRVRKTSRGFTVNNTMQIATAQDASTVLAHKLEEANRKLEAALALLPTKARSKIMRSDDRKGGTIDVSSITEAVAPTAPATQENIPETAAAPVS